LDVEMPHITGVDLCQSLRNSDRWGALPVLFLTAHTDAKTIDQVFTAGADDFVSKPVVGPELVNRILNRLDRVKLLGKLTKREDPCTHQSETSLRKLKDELELRVAERTAELVSVNQRLQQELEERRQAEAALHVSKPACPES
jgi:DNA-binding response OmpR family regulator